jgi:hypothetical protein
VIKTCYSNGRKERLCLIIDKCRRQKLCKRAQKISAAAPLRVMASRYNPQFLHIRIEIIHGSHMYILFLPRVGFYVSFLPLGNARGKTSWHKGLPVIKTIYTYGFHELFIKQWFTYNYRPNNGSHIVLIIKRSTFCYKMI